MARGNEGKVSLAAWNVALKDIEARFKKLEKGNDTDKKPTISIHAWDAALKDFGERFDKIEAKLNELSDKVEGKVSVNAWNRSNKEFDDRLKKRVSIKAWEASLVELDSDFKKLALDELKELDDRLDNTNELITKLTEHLSNKVTVSAWNQLCQSNESLIDRVDSLTSKNDDTLNRLVIIEKMLREAKISEDELKKLLETI